MQSLSKTVSYRDILGIALPMVVSQASETVMLFADRIFLSRVSMVAFSAALAGGVSNFVFQSFFLGLLGYANALVAQYYGAQKMEHGLRTVSQGIILSCIAYPLSLLLIPIGRFSFGLAGHSPVQIEYEYAYFSILMAASIFSFTRTILSSFFIGIGRTQDSAHSQYHWHVHKHPPELHLHFWKAWPACHGYSGGGVWDNWGNNYNQPHSPHCLLAEQ